MEFRNLHSCFLPPSTTGSQPEEILLHPPPHRCAPRVPRSPARRGERDEGHRAHPGEAQVRARGQLPAGGAPPPSELRRGPGAPAGGQSRPAPGVASGRVTGRPAGPWPPESGHDCGGADPSGGLPPSLRDCSHSPGCGPGRSPGAGIPLTGRGVPGGAWVREQARSALRAPPGFLSPRHTRRVAPQLCLGDLAATS